MRAFVALPLDDGGRAGLQELSARLAAEPWGAGVRWVAASNLHLTLCFLGDTDASTLERVAEELEVVGRRYAPFEWRLDRVEPFPAASRPRVIAARVAQADGIGRLAASVARAVARCGFELERRRFRAHVTLGRVKRDGPRRLELAEPLTNPTQRAGEIVLYRSELHSDGALYAALARVALAGVSPP